MPADITAGPDGNLWFTQVIGDPYQSSGKIGRITTDGVVTEFPVPMSVARPVGITWGPDGNVWFTEGWSGAVFRMTTDGAMTPFPTPTGWLGGPSDIVTGPDGNLWFTESQADKIGRVTPAGTVTEFPLPATMSGPTGIAAGPDGNLWFTVRDSNRIGRMTTAGVVTGEFAVPTADSGLRDIAPGPDGHLWFTEESAEQIGRITSTGEITEFPVASVGALGPAGIAAGPDGNLWFTAGNVVGRMTPNGAAATFPLPTANAGATRIAAGSDGNLWFTESSASQIGRITTPGACPGSTDSLCLNAGRFEVRVAWSAPPQGTSGVGQAIPLTGDTGSFWFFNKENVEVVVKVLDGTALNGHFWVFSAGLSDVQYTVTVRDKVMGTIQTYENAYGTLASVADTLAFTPSGSSTVATPAASTENVGSRSAKELDGLFVTLTRNAAVPKLAPACSPGGTTLCLNQARFRLTVDWAVPDQGRSGHGNAVPIAGDTGYFWFFNDANVELVVKVLDGTLINGHFWVFYGALSDVEYTITVTDTQTQAVRTYFNPHHTLASVADTAAF